MGLSFSGDHTTRTSLPLHFATILICSGSAIAQAACFSWDASCAKITSTRTLHSEINFRGQKPSASEPSLAMCASLPFSLARRHLLWHCWPNPPFPCSVLPVGYVVLVLFLSLHANDLLRALLEVWT
jgi:hypothetical protein